MCGIFGYVGTKNNAAELTLEALKKLEYRGYDSWGIGVETSRKFVIDKHAGKIGIAKTNLPGSDFAFGHTRWATHGSVTDTNAHPHLDCSGKIAVVHNGIVENYQEIKNLLADKHKIVSETDTELVAHLIEDYFYNKKLPLHEAVRQAFLKLRGLSAFLVAETGSKTLVAVKTGSPLVVGVGKGENMVGSDVNCLLSLTKNVIFIEDSQLVQITKNNINLFSVETGKEIKPKVQKITWEATTATKGDFPHFMLKEIHEEPRVLENISQNFSERITNFANLLKGFSKIYLVACGTAHYVAIAGSYILSKVANKEVIPVAGSEFVYKEPFLEKNTLVVFLSQSGETMDIIEPLKKVKQKKVKTAALVNVFGSTLYRLADFKICLEAGPEICVLSTKTCIAKLGILGLTSYGLIEKYEDGNKLLKKCINDLNFALNSNFQDKYLDPLAALLYKKEHFYVIGRGLSYPIALEAALKIKEDSYIHAEAFSGGELKHGPIALAEKETPYFVLAPNDETYEETLSNAMEIKARGGLIIGLSEKPNDIFDYHIPVADSGIFTMITQLAIAQLLAYKLTVKRGYDPDKPRNLAKSVTVK
jgi:glucosamine--fructose-6-phosphate aminotransferase (isomerizing)